ncbi:hypothetical protein [Siphonobacter sp. SORGH_AS_1065]|uniref:hypothetical protein n=1 Tax=Siphonobacter sp. SORGH_AS_1065 TaxID=3041795 RepID=UPI0027802611|nr:hypothetical protein [Siphonobacter sp. SORGH_AS_1065]MDQ1089805.1 hypothetical protein [Siphonobacter sp. SORGH_AS_1065]
MASNALYVRFSDDIEVIQSSEGAIIQGTLESMNRQAQKALEQIRPAKYIAHAKHHGMLKARLQVYDNLPQGVFKMPHPFDAISCLPTSFPRIRLEATREHSSVYRT